jgi:valyl-tRNA synthetase
MASAMYTFIWDNFCSRFLETAKADFLDENSETREGTLATFDYVLSRILRLLHPFAPFITEELWLRLGYGKETIQFENWPKVRDLDVDKIAAVRAEKLYQTADTGRRLRAEYNIPSNQKTTMKIIASDGLSSNEQITLTKLMNLENLILVEEKPPKTPLAFTPLGDLFLPLEGLIDPEKEKERLQKEIEKATIILERENKKLRNESMCSKAPPEVVKEWHRLADEATKKIEKFKQQIENL